MVAPENCSEDIEARVLKDTARLRCSLDTDLRQNPGNAPEHPHLVVLSGLPGTGKSHFARELVQRAALVVVGSDRCRKALVPRPKYTKGEHARVFDACHQLIEELLTRGYSVVFDATNLTERFRQPLYDIARRTSAGLVVVWFTAPGSLVRRRLDERAAGVKEDSYSDADWQVYCRLRPGQEAVQGPHLVVDSSVDIFAALETIVRRVAANVATSAGATC